MVTVSAAVTNKTARENEGDLAAGAIEACRRLIGIDAVPVSPSRPGHLRRRPMGSIRMRAGNASVIATRRKDAKRTRLESDALLVFGRAHAPAPRLLAGDERWLIQEDVGTTRLNELLHRASAREGLALLERAAEGLWRCQDAALRANLGSRGEVLDGVPELLGVTAKIGERLKSPPPELAENVLPALLRPLEAVFVKWDARPANAIVSAKGEIFWIDWEEWGRRCRLDDLVWLVCDEWVPDWGEAEDEFIAREIARRGKQFDKAGPIYVATFGCLHALMRLEIILRIRRDGPRWSDDDCLAYDLIGVNRDCALRLIARARRFAAKVPALAPLRDWIATLSLPR